MKVAYVRVSTIEQNEGRQTAALEQYGIERWFTEKVSAKDANRPELKSMMDFVRSGDVVYIHDFSRLARNTRDLLTIVESLNDKGVALVSNKESLDTSTPTGKLMLTMLAAINQFERENLLERQREGIELAKKEGRYMGRKSVMIDDDVFEKAYERYMRRELTKVEFATELGISRPTLDKLLKERNETGNK